MAGFWCERQHKMHFFHRGSVIMDYGLVFELKTSYCWICFSFCLLQMITDGLECCGLLWCFYQTLILTAPIHCRASIDSHSDGTHSLQSIHWLSFWRHPFTAEHPLTLILTAPIHWCSDTDAMQHFSKSDEETNSSLSWMDWGWVHFWINCSFKSLLIRKANTQPDSVSGAEIFKALAGYTWGCISRTYCSVGYASSLLVAWTHTWDMLQNHLRVCQRGLSVTVMQRSALGLNT